MFPFLCIYFCVSMTMSGYVPVGVGAYECGCLWWPEGGKSPGPGFVGSCELCNVGARLDFRCSARRVHAYNCWVIYLFQYFIYLDAYMCICESYSVFSLSARYCEFLKVPVKINCNHDISQTRLHAPLSHFLHFYSHFQHPGVSSNSMLRLKKEDSILTYYKEFRCYILISQFDWRKDSSFKPSS